MKRVLLLLLPVIMLTSCERQYLVPSGDVPAWLREMISEAESGVSAPPMFASSFGAWKRYEYDRIYYFEWINPVSSYFPPVYDFSGNEFPFTHEKYTEYQNGKCCRKYVWKGSEFPPDYDEW